VSLDPQASRRSDRLTPEDRARLQEISATVARAARVLIRQGYTALSLTDLEAVGMLAVWRKLPMYDPARAAFDDWAFYQAQHAMLDASRGEHKETTFTADLRTGARGYTAQDDRPAESDFHNDTPETDRRRITARTRRMGVAAWIEATADRARTAASFEQHIETTEQVLALRDDIAGLSEEQRTYILLRFWNDQEVKDVVEQMGVPERTLRRRFVEARDRLEAALARRGVFGVPEGFTRAADALPALEETRR
jgi:RNA polymerase sigma factor (sigma-70 family)